MPAVYFDSSALVKLLVAEEGTDLVVDLWNSCDAALTTRLAYPEVRAALHAGARDQRLTDRELASAESAWESLWAGVRPVELTARVARAAGGLAGALRLSGADAVHLAGALALEDDEVVMAVWDRRLHAGAVASGLRVAPSSLAT